MAKTVKKKTSEPKNIENKQTAPIKTRAKKDLSNINPDLTDAFIQEVDEDVKNDNLKVLWNRYGLLIIAFVVLAVSAAISFDQIKNWKVAQNQRHTEEYMAAAQFQAENPDATIAALQQVSQKNQGIFSDFARLQIANVLLNQDKIEEALTALEGIVNDKQVNSEVQHIALIKLATYKLDTMDRASFEQLLQPLVAENTSWTPMVQDLLAMSAIKNGDIATARTIYENILKIEDLPDSFKIKVQDMLSSISDM
ncbi:MAG: tetratricopeptide repeat protein [Alphaproteobacteria bacterium]|nr:tetratricopeptide repeat protein [Alphaproteobacteria bacterium]